MLGMSALAIDLLARPARRIRRSGGAYDADGRWVGGAESLTDVMAVIQPVDPDDLQALPEGERSEASKAVWTRTELRTAREDAHEADIVEADGARWKILAVFDRAEGGWYKAIAGRLDG